MRKCVKCGLEKELEKFRKRQIWFSHTCKACYSAQYATGKPNTGRFVKGQVSWRKGKKGILKREKPRYAKKGRLLKSEHIVSGKRAVWALEIKKRDGFKCQSCGSENDLHAHHIIPWKENEEERFKLYNGVTLCRSCHSRTERLLETAKKKYKL